MMSWRTWICPAQSRRRVRQETAGRRWSGTACRPDCARTDGTPARRWEPAYARWPDCRRGRHDTRSSDHATTTRAREWKRRCESSVCPGRRTRWTRAAADQGRGLRAETDFAGEPRRRCRLLTRRGARAAGPRRVPDVGLRRPVRRLARGCAVYPTVLDTACIQRTWQ